MQLLCKVLSVFQTSSNGNVYRSFMYCDTFSVCNILTCKTCSLMTKQCKRDHFDIILLRIEGRLLC